MKKQLQVREDETILLSLSRISSEKNIQAIVKQMPDILAANPKVKLLIVGDGPYLEELKDMATALGVDANVIFTGMIPHDKVSHYYKACDFFISASTSETQGLTYIESLACGKPIIAHGNAYLDELVSDKMFGTLYYHESDLADAVLDAILETPKMSQDLLEQKRYEISSEHFGQSVYTFYLDTLINKSERDKQKLSLRITSSSKRESIKLVQSARQLPTRAFKATAVTSAKVVKAPLKMVNAIRDFLE